MDFAEEEVDDYCPGPEADVVDEVRPGGGGHGGWCVERVFGLREGCR